MSFKKRKRREIARVDLNLNKVPETSSSEPLYDLTSGGYYKAQEFSDDPKTISRIQEATYIIEQLLNHLRDNDLLD